MRSESYLPVPSASVTPVPAAWKNRRLTMQIEATNVTHYTFSAKPADSGEKMMIIGYGAGDLVSWGFTGKLISSLLLCNHGLSQATLWYFQDLSRSDHNLVRIC